MLPHHPISSSYHPTFSILRPIPLLPIHSYLVVCNVAIVLGSSYIRASVVGSLRNSTWSLSKVDFLGLLLLMYPPSSSSRAGMLLTASQTSNLLSLLFSRSAQSLTPIPLILTIHCRSVAHFQKAKLCRIATTKYLSCLV